MSAQIGFIPGLTGDDVNSDPIRGDFDFLGFDDSTRADAGFFRAVSDAFELALEQGNFGAAEQISRLGAFALTEGFDLSTTTARPKLVLGGNYGNSYDLKNGDEFGFFVAGNYRYEWNQRTDGQQITYEGDVDAGTLQPKDAFIFEEATNNTEISGLLNLGYAMGNSTYGSNTLLSRVTQSRARANDGIDGDAVLPSYRYVIDWVERQFVSQQFTGNHVWGGREEWVLDWQVTGSQADRESPGRREARFDLLGQDSIYDLQVPVVSKRFDELVDNNFDFTANLDYVFDTSTDFETKLTIGTQLIKRERDADSETYGFSDSPVPDTNAPNRVVSDVVNGSTITGNPSTGYGFRDITLPSDSYESELDLNAVFFNFDTLTYDKHQFVAGARYEYYNQITDTFDINTGNPIRSELRDTVLLPGFAYNFFATERQTIRFGVSQTVSRPDFKETAQALFFDPDFDFVVRGNPFLEVSDATNVDARYQFYFDDVDNISFGLFYKDIDKPIERVNDPGSGTIGNVRTFENAEEAEIYGIEFEGRKEFSIGQSLTKSWFVAANFSFIESEVTIKDAELICNPPPGTPVPQQCDRALQGQPDYVANLILGFDDIENGHELTLLFNQNGDTIVDVGVSGQADVVLEPRLQVDLNYRWFFTDTWQFVFKAQNLTDDEVETTQDDRTFQSFKTGREYTFGVNWNF